ncbi:hypothetical protein [Fusibacter sp. 3D3]|uniref:hypothetical protein n=1 Tax=Fusibacter sp. 3D3 TaxID=1048380 RepID=UPI000853E4A6|nr:hypothetical protein [Fusibacter sp. 3D3]GAU77875.1 hypothetical protein F3D3_2504 [Fusibacter sp. 3D3]
MSLELDAGRRTPDEYRSWGYDVYEGADFSTLKNVTFAFKKGKAIALDFSKGNARSTCSSLTNARIAAAELKNFYSMLYRESFPVSVKGLAFELLYHAIPDTIYDIFKSLRQVPGQIGLVSGNIYDVLNAVVKQDHFYWADSGVNDRLRRLDGPAGILYVLCDTVPATLQFVYAIF